MGTILNDGVVKVGVSMINCNSINVTLVAAEFRVASTDTIYDIVTTKPLIIA